MLAEVALKDAQIPVVDLQALMAIFVFIGRLARQARYTKERSIFLAFSFSLLKIQVAYLPYIMKISGFLYNFFGFFFSITKNISVLFIICYENFWIFSQ